MRRRAQILLWWLALIPVGVAFVLAFVVGLLVAAVIDGYQAGYNL